MKYKDIFYYIIAYIYSGTGEAGAGCGDMMDVTGIRTFNIRGVHRLIKCLEICLFSRMILVMLYYRVTIYIYRFIYIFFIQKPQSGSI